MAGRLNEPEAAALTVVVGATVVAEPAVVVEPVEPAFLLPESPHAAIMNRAATSTPAVLRADLVPTFPPFERSRRQCPRALHARHDRRPTVSDLPRAFD